MIFRSDHDPGMFLVKRVIGLPLERVTVAEGQVHIDGITLAEPWVSGSTTPACEARVPEDALWLLGDNRPRSAGDSRNIGPVALDDIGWLALAIYWPPGRVGLV